MWIVAAVGALALNVLACEIYDRCEALARYLIRFSARGLPDNEQNRYQEEWLAHLAECHGKVSKLVHALGVCWSSRMLIRDLKGSRNGAGQVDMSRVSRKLKLLFASSMACQLLILIAAIVPHLLGTRLHITLGVPWYASMVVCGMFGATSAVSLWVIRKKATG